MHVGLFRGRRHKAFWKMKTKHIELPPCDHGPEATLDGQVRRLISRWPMKIRREIDEWFGNGSPDRGHNPSKPAQRRWRYLCDKLSKNI